MSGWRCPSCQSQMKRKQTLKKLASFSFLHHVRHLSASWVQHLHQFCFQRIGENRLDLAIRDGGSSQVSSPPGTLQWGVFLVLQCPVLPDKFPETPGTRWCHLSSSLRVTWTVFGIKACHIIMYARKSLNELSEHDHCIGKVISNSPMLPAENKSRWSRKVLHIWTAQTSVFRIFLIHGTQWVCLCLFNSLCLLFFKNLVCFLMKLEEYLTCMIEKHLYWLHELSSYSFWVALSHGHMLCTRICFVLS